MQWTELEWQRLNAKLRIVMIVVLLGFGITVYVMGLSPCDKCYFQDSRGGINNKVSCTSIMHYYGEAISTEDKDPQMYAVSKALMNNILNMDNLTNSSRTNYQDIKTINQLFNRSIAQVPGYLP
jgi:hypothetical protein